MRHKSKYTCFHYKGMTKFIRTIHCAKPRCKNRNKKVEITIKELIYVSLIQIRNNGEISFRLFRMKQTCQKFVTNEITISITSVTECRLK